MSRPSLESTRRPTSGTRRSAASRAALAALTATSDQLAAGLSLCVEADGGGPDALRPLRRRTQARLAVGLVLLLAGTGVLLAYQAEALPRDSRRAPRARHRCRCPGSASWR